MIHADLSQMDGCPSKANVTVYGYPWNSMLMFGVAAGPVKNRAELQKSAISSPNAFNDYTKSSPREQTIVRVSTAPLRGGCADRETAMRKILDIASTVEPVQDGRIHIEKVNGPMLYEHKATAAVGGLFRTHALGGRGFATTWPLRYTRPLACGSPQRLRTAS